MKNFLLLLCAVALPGQIAPPSSAVFDKDAVHEIRLTFKQADWYEQLTTTYNTMPDNTPYLEGSLVWGSYKFDSVGVRFKGNSSYSGATTRKKPFRIKLNEFVKGQKIEKMASFSLSNGWNDPSFVREKAYYEMAQKAGLPAARSNFAALYVNGEYLGLYILGEVVNGDFLDNHFAKADLEGNLYKADSPGANLAYLGEDAAAYQTTFSKQSNEAANDWTDLIELARIFEQTPSAELPAKLTNLIDIDSFLTALALDNLTVNTDSYVGMAQNYYLYRRSTDRRWVWIPWDPSLAFGALGQGEGADLALEWVQGATGGAGAGGGGFPGGLGGSGGRPVATKLWSVPEYKQRYRQIYQRLVDEVFVPSQVIARMNVLRDLIRSGVEKDTQKLVTMAQFEAAMKGGEAGTITPGTTPGGPGNPGGPGAGGFGGGAPALEPFI
ncbi:MAG: CotH kinase family protein, partial [Bryobacteraceae bacterium]